MDTSPKKRRETPEFYGFVPPTGRGLVFLLMMVNSTAQFLAKIISIALLGAVSGAWTLTFLSADIGLYLLYTIVRKDIFWYPPVQSYGGSLAVGLLARIWMKVRNE